MNKKIEDNTSTIVPSLDDFKSNFDDFFSERCLDGLNWDHIIVAGGSVMRCLLSMETQLSSSIFHNKYSYDRSNIREVMERYKYLTGSNLYTWRIPSNYEEFEEIRKKNTWFYKKIGSESDIDLYLIDLTEEEANQKIIDIYNTLSKNCDCTILTIRSKYSITFRPMSQRYRSIQVILRIYETEMQVITGFDIDACCCYYDGDRVYGNQRFIDSMISKIIWIHEKRQSESYLSRLKKYHQYGFSICCADFNKDRINFKFIWKVNKCYYTYFFISNRNKEISVIKLENNSILCDFTDSELTDTSRSEEDKRIIKKRELIRKKKIEEMMEVSNNGYLLLTITYLGIYMTINCKIKNYINENKIIFKISKEDYEKFKNKSNNIRLNYIELKDNLVGIIGQLYYNTYLKELHEHQNREGSLYLFKNCCIKYKDKSDYEHLKLSRFSDYDNVVRSITLKNISRNKDCLYVFSKTKIDEDSIIFNIKSDELNIVDFNEEIRRYKTNLSQKLEYIKQDPGTQFTGSFHPTKENLFKGIY